MSERRSISPHSKSSSTIDNEDLSHLPIRPWNANVKAYSKQEPSIPWYKRQSRDRVPRESSGTSLDSKPDALDKLRTSRNPNHRKQIKVSDIRNSTLFSQLSIDKINGGAFDWSVTSDDAINFENPMRKKSPAPSSINDSSKSINSMTQSNESNTQAHHGRSRSPVDTRGSKIPHLVDKDALKHHSSHDTEQTSATRKSLGSFQKLSGKELKAYSTKLLNDESDEEVKEESKDEVDDRTKQLGTQNTMFTSQMSINLGQIYEDDGIVDMIPMPNSKSPVKVQTPTSVSNVSPSPDDSKPSLLRRGEALTSVKFLESDGDLELDNVENSHSDPAVEVDFNASDIYKSKRRIESNTNKSPTRPTSGDAHAETAPKRGLNREVSSIKFSEENIMLNKNRNQVTKPPLPRHHEPSHPNGLSSNTLVDKTKTIFNHRNPLQSHGPTHRNHHHHQESHLEPVIEEETADPPEPEDIDLKKVRREIMIKSRNLPASRKAKSSKTLGKGSDIFKLALDDYDGNEEEDNAIIFQSVRRKFTPLETCFFCQADLTKLNLSDHILHVRGCMHTYDNNIAKTIRLTHEEDASGEVLEPPPMQRPGLLRQNSSVRRSFTSRSIKSNKNGVDVSTQTMGALVDFTLMDTFNTPTPPPSEQDHVVEERTKLLSKDLSFKVNKIIERKSELMRNATLSTIQIEAVLSDVHQHAIPVDETATMPPSPNNSTREIAFPKPSFMAHGHGDKINESIRMVDKVVETVSDKVITARPTLMKEKSKTFQTPAAMEQPKTKESEEKELERLKEELQELVAKLSVFRMKERLLRGNIKKMSEKVSKTQTDVTAKKESEKPPEEIVPEHLQKYRRMLKMMPVDAVKGRMTVEGVTPDDQKFVLKILEEKSKATETPRLAKVPHPPAEPPPQPVAEAPVPEHLQKYRKMLKMMPIEAVKGRMTVEGVTPADQALVLKILEPPGAASKQALPPPVIELPEHLKKYQQMAKRLPEAAVVGRMTIEGITADDQKLVLNSLKSPEEQAKVTPPLPPPPAALPEHLKKYETMIKRLPEAAVIGRMTIDGISPADQKLVLSLLKPEGRGTDANTVAAVAISPPKPSGPKLTGFFWDVIDKEKIDADENVWKLIMSVKTGQELQGTEYENLVTYFTKKDMAKVKKEKEEAAAAAAAALSSKSISEDSVKSPRGGDKPKKKVAKVLTERLVSVSIAVSSLKGVNIDKICLGIQNIDIRLISMDEVTRMSALLPNESKNKGDADKVFALEMNQFRDLEKKGVAIDDLIDAEQVLFKLYQIDNIKDKIKVIIFLLTCGTTVKNFTHKCQILASTADAVCQSEGLIEIFHAVLCIGNSLNAGTAKGGALGFKFNNLLKLDTVKATSVAMTALDFLVQILYERHKQGNVQGQLALTIDDDLSAKLHVSCTISPSDYSDPSKIRIGDPIGELEKEFKETFEDNMRLFHKIIQQEWDPDSKDHHMINLMREHESITAMVTIAKDHIDDAKKNIHNFERFYLENPNSAQVMLETLDQFVTIFHKSKEKYMLLKGKEERKAKSVKAVVR